MLWLITSLHHIAVLPCCTSHTWVGCGTPSVPSVPPVPPGTKLTSRRWKHPRTSRCLDCGSLLSARIARLHLVDEKRKKKRWGAPSRLLLLEAVSMSRASPTFCPSADQSIQPCHRGITRSQPVLPAQLPSAVPHCPLTRRHSVDYFDSCVYVSRLSDYRAKPYLGTPGGRVTFYICQTISALGGISWEARTRIVDADCGRGQGVKLAL